MWPERGRGVVQRYIMDEMALDSLRDLSAALTYPNAHMGGFQLCEYLNSDLLLLAIAHVSTEPQMCTLE